MEQGDNLERVSQRITAAILGFVGVLEGRAEFHADDLRAYVTAKAGQTAPGSADRVLRKLRQRGLLNYELISRRESLYRVMPLEPEWTPPAPQTVEQINLL
jgi:hypothetical protein